MERGILSKQHSTSHTCQVVSVIWIVCVSLVVCKQRVYYHGVIAGVDGSATSCVCHVGTVDFVSLHLGIVLHEVAGKHLQLTVGEDGTSKASAIVAEVAVAHLKGDAAVANRTVYASICFEIVS